jgi:hypothetical protein
MRSTVWKKFNLSYHLISLRNRIGPFNSGAWVLSAAHARGWLNGSLMVTEGLGFPSISFSIVLGMSVLAEVVPLSLA